MMKGSYKFGLTGARCLILCAAAALIGCAIYLFSVSQVEAALDRNWFPFAQLQALTAGMDGKTPESVCLVLAALPVFGFIAQLLRNRFKPEDLLLLLSAVLLYLVMKNPLTLEGIFTQPTVQPAVFWTALLAWAGLRILRASCAAEGAPLLRIGGWAVCAAALYFAYGAGANIGTAVYALRLSSLGAAMAGGVSISPAALFSKLVLAFVSAFLGVGACVLTLSALRRYALDGELSDAVVGAVGRLSRFCATALAGMLLLSASLAVADVLLVRSGSGGLSSVSFPVSALIYCFAVLLGARFIAAHKRLRDENDMFI